MSDAQKDFWQREQIDERRHPSHPAIECFARTRLDAIQKSVPLASSHSVLELGAGNGYFSYYLDPLCQLTATDASARMLGLNPVRNKLLMDAADLAYPDDSFDVAFESCLLHHVERAETVLAEMKRVARKHVVLIEPNRNNPLVLAFCLAIPEERGGMKYSLRYLRHLAESQGLRVVAAFSHGVIAPNMTPRALLPVVKPFDRGLPFFGVDNVVICEV